jgi:hypothetical protein
MIVTDDLKAKYVFGQLTLEEALDLFVFGRAGEVRVVSKDGRFDETHEKFGKKGDYLVIYEEDEHQRWFFSLSQVVEIKNNYILVSVAEKFYELHFFEKRALNLDFGLHKS